MKLEPVRRFVLDQTASSLVQVVQAVAAFLIGIDGEASDYENVGVSSQACLRGMVTT